MGAASTRRCGGSDPLYQFGTRWCIGRSRSYLTLLTPPPLSRPLKVSRLGVSTAKTLRLARVGLERLGVNMARYGERNYEVTQNIGAALAFLGLDGLIAPSARWPCDNLMIYQSNHMLTDRLEVIDDERVDWGAWARANGLLPT